MKYLSRIFAVVAIAALGIWFWHHFASRTLAAEIPPPPMVAVVTVAHRDLFKEISVQAEFRPNQEIELHPKVSGYLQKIFVDFGDKVKAGDPIATLEVPELQDDLDRTIAAEQRAEADYRYAHLDYTRLAEVQRSQPNLLAQQEIDAVESKDAMAAANLAAARAERQKYQNLSKYTRITAPFDGVITQRYADPGALIQAGTTSNTQAQPLVRLSENDRLRLDFDVSVAYAGEIAVGDPVDILVDGRTQALHGTVARRTERIAMATRTMEVEVDVPNPDLKLIPGMYATAVLKTELRPKALALPVEAVSGGSQPTVYLIGRDHRIEERRVVLGLETSTDYEVLSGLREGDRVMVGSRATVHAGQSVETKAIQLAGNP